MDKTTNEMERIIENYVSWVKALNFPIKDNKYIDELLFPSPLTLRLFLVDVMNDTALVEQIQKSLDIEAWDPSNDLLVYMGVMSHLLCNVNDNFITDRIIGKPDGKAKQRLENLRRREIEITQNIIKVLQDRLTSLEGRE